MDDGLLLLLVIAGLLALIPAKIAAGKGRSFAAWWIFGLLVWLLAFPLSILATDRRERCPECRGVVLAGARRCPHCRSVIPEAPAEEYRFLGL